MGVKWGVRGGRLEVKEKRWARIGGGFSVLDKASVAKVLAKCSKFLSSET